MAIGHLFTPIGPTVNINAGSSSARVAVTPLSVNEGMSRELRVVNSGTVVVFIEFGDSTVVASTSTSMPILPGTVESFMISAAITNVAAITVTGASNVYLTTGLGI